MGNGWTTAPVPVPVGPGTLLVLWKPQLLIAPTGMGICAPVGICTIADLTAEDDDDEEVERVVGVEVAAPPPPKLFRPPARPSALGEEVAAGVDAKVCAAVVPVRCGMMPPRARVCELVDASPAAVDELPASEPWFEMVLEGAVTPDPPWNLSAKHFVRSG